MATGKSTRKLDEIDVIDTTVQKTFRWIDELKEELGGVGRREAFRNLRAFLQTIRDRLTVDEAAHLGAQLPMLVRGIYYEAWAPSRVPIKMKSEEFLVVFAERAQLPAGHDAAAALKASARVMRRHLSSGENEDVLSVLPHDVRRLLE